MLPSYHLSRNSLRSSNCAKVNPQTDFQFSVMRTSPEPLFLLSPELHLHLLALALGLAWLLVIGGAELEMSPLASQNILRGTAVCSPKLISNHASMHPCLLGRSHKAWRMKHIKGLSPSVASGISKNTGHDDSGCNERVLAAELVWS